MKLNRYAITALVLSTITLSIAVSSCISAGSRDIASSKHENQNSDLSWAEAKARKARLSEIKYKLEVNLTSNAQTFNGLSKIDFKLSDLTMPLRIDFFEGQVSSIQVNGQPIDLATKSTYQINLPISSLKLGPNQVVIQYTQNYSTQGQGLHRFVDPQTKEVFLYTQFETFDANRFMPCFDQPDLRATLDLSVMAPKTWTVISATKETQVKPSGKGAKLWIFGQTPEIATYLYSLHAGPYKVWTDDFQGMPLRLFARPSMAKHVRVKEWFTYTKQGLKFFNSYFNYPYPFKKYDQIVVPEFNAGAMENVAAVTFNEGFLWRFEPTRRDLRNLASVILHEMAHMWFGDVVTMKWWNDLWLNESFATYMATLALVEATVFKEGWQDFFASEKNWAYWEDSLITTHPIEAPVPSVKVAFATFDGITYGKGASVIKQLNSYIGNEAFKKGIQDYIRTYAYKNAELSEFISSLQKHSSRDLGLWSERWLKQSGTDKIASRWQCNGDKLNEIELIVTPPQGRQFRPQTITLALFQDKNGNLSEVRTKQIDLTSIKQKASGAWPCPDFVYPNFQDNGYIAVQLDAKSMQYALKNLSRFNDNLLRTMVWDDLWEMARNTEIPLRDYIQVIDSHFAKEQDPIIANQVVNTISGRGKASVVGYWPQFEDRQKNERLKFIEKTEQEYLRRLKSAKPGSDDQRFWFDNFANIAQSSTALKQLYDWEQKSKVASGMALDLDRNWVIVRQLSRYKHPKATESLGVLKIKDSSDRGLRNALSAEAIAPDLTLKKKWIDILTTSPKPQLSFAEVRAVSFALFPFEQKSLAKEFEDNFYQYLQANRLSENEIFVQTIASGLSPLRCRTEESLKLKKFIKEESKFSPGLVRGLKIELDEDERCQKVQAMSAL